MKIILKNKNTIISAAVFLIMLAVVLTVFINPRPKPPIDSVEPVGATEPDVTISVPSVKPDGNSKSTEKPVDSSVPDGVAMLDVGGNPNGSSNVPSGTNSGNSATNNYSETVDNPSQNQPFVDVGVVPDAVENKDEPPNPQPPPDGFVQVPPEPINPDKSVEKPLTEIGLLVGANLEKAGYNTLFLNAGSPREMVENAVKNYAQTGNVTLNPSAYGLPELVGEYHIKLAVKGVTITESAKYISDYMIADKAFNDKVKTVFNQYKDGYLSVYQKDGNFYVLFAVIDKGYVS